MGFADPFSVAEVEATRVAAAVVVVGALGVVNVSTAPKPVPSAFWAIAQ